jgi:hypothetical protein
MGLLSVNGSAEFVPDNTKDQAEPGPLIFVAGARFELATFRLWVQRTTKLLATRDDPGCTAGLRDNTAP